MAKWKIWVALLVLFVSGVLIGNVGTRMYMQHKLSSIFSRERPAVRNLFVRRLTRELDLTREQREEIEEIASHAAEKFQELHTQQLVAYRSSWNLAAWLSDFLDFLPLLSREIEFTSETSHEQVPGQRAALGKKCWRACAACASEVRRCRIGPGARPISCIGHDDHLVPLPLQSPCLGHKPDGSCASMANRSCSISGDVVSR